MKPYLIWGSSLFLIIAVLSGSATRSFASVEKEIAAISYISQDPGERAFQYRAQAHELYTVADRLEIEAAWYAEHFGSDSEQARLKRVMAQDIRTKAHAAEQREQESLRQLPHARAY